MLKEVKKLTWSPYRQGLHCTWMGFLKLCQNWASVLRIYEEKLLKHSERARKRKIESPPVLHLRHQFLESHWKDVRVRRCKQQKSFVCSDATIYVRDNGNVCLLNQFETVTGNCIWSHWNSSQSTSLPMAGSVILIWFHYILLKWLPWKHQILKFTKSSWMEIELSTRIIEFLSVQLEQTMPWCT